jgi:hypothetical protein
MIDSLSKHPTENPVSEDSCKFSGKIGHFFEREKYQPQILGVSRILGG